MSTPTRQPRPSPNAARDAAIFADSVVGGGKMNNGELALKYELKPKNISAILARQKKQRQRNQET